MYPVYYILNKLTKIFKLNVLFIYQNYAQILQTDYEILKARKLFAAES